TDTSGNTSSCSFSVCVQATIPPVVTLVPGGVTLWPPNHIYHTVQLSDCIASAVSQCFGPLDVNSPLVGKVRDVWSDEYEDDRLYTTGQGDGHTCNDIVIIGNTVQV